MFYLCSMAFVPTHPPMPPLSVPVNAMHTINARAFQKAVLTWYTANARTLPWRIPPRKHTQQKHQKPDPYRVWLAEIMLQQTTVPVGIKYYNTFTALWPTLADFAAARDGDVMAAWAGLGYYARARNALRTARIVRDQHAGHFPSDIAALLALPGIGTYTAAAIAAIAFDRKAVVVDGNIERIIARLYAIQTPLPQAKANYAQNAAQLTPQQNAGDYAQALMDIGALVCTPRKPRCAECPIKRFCCGRQTNPMAYPVRPPKKQKPMRIGTVYVIERSDGALAIEQRPKRGLLGGMLSFPSSAWQSANSITNNTDAHTPPAPPPAIIDPAPPAHAWNTLPHIVHHTFTHFHLRLTVQTIIVPLDSVLKRGFFALPTDFDPQALPTLMRKVLTLVQTKTSVLL